MLSTRLQNASLLQHVLAQLSPSILAECVLKTVPHATFQLLRIGVYVFANPQPFKDEAQAALFAGPVRTAL
jgi:hypothetical protein